MNCRQRERLAANMLYHLTNDTFRVKLDDILYIDSGNGEFTGQVACGVKMGGKF